MKIFYNDLLNNNRTIRTRRDCDSHLKAVLTVVKQASPGQKSLHGLEIFPDQPRKLAWNGRGESKFCKLHYAIFNVCGGFNT